ncbi:hypothetical protein ACFXPW_07840 [Streptomyces goshikiensis]|uniref:hypothetical protein n=1 Tax=Streptomyces goshikiensis TaxID=1942 RepID=UPI0036851A13
MVGPRTSRQHDDTTFAVYCNNPPKTGRHNYRLEARGYAIANDGTEVSGYLQYGKASSWTCVQPTEEAPWTWSFRGRPSATPQPIPTPGRKRSSPPPQKLARPMLNRKSPGC